MLAAVTPFPDQILAVGRGPSVHVPFVPRRWLERRTVDAMLNLLGEGPLVACVEIDFRDVVLLHNVGRGARAAAMVLFSSNFRGIPVAGSCARWSSSLYLSIQNAVGGTSNYLERARLMDRV